MAIKSLVFYEPYKHSIHAELSAIMSVKNKNLLRYCKIYVVKITNGEIRGAIPCHKCEKLLIKYKLNFKDLRLTHSQKYFYTNEYFDLIMIR